MTFEEWWRKSWGNSWKDGAPVSDWSSGHVEQSKIACKEAWDCQQERIDHLESIIKANQIRPRGKSMLAYLPEGYVLVPVEPTEKMEEAGLEVHPWDYTEDMQKIYKAMIQAAQEKE